MRYQLLGHVILHKGTLIFAEEPFSLRQQFNRRSSHGTYESLRQPFQSLTGYTAYYWDVKSGIYHEKLLYIQIPLRHEVEFALTHKAESPIVWPQKGGFQRPQPAIALGGLSGPCNHLHALKNCRGPFITASNVYGDENGVFKFHHRPRLSAQPFCFF